MQKPIRYYITKSGEEPTVRSVAVALPAPRLDDRSEMSSNPSIEHPEPMPETVQPASGVKRLVKDAIRKRSPRR